eukprot:GHVN01002020.1.p1 GENE.GHVN01002020.1~~GHVN01002020.1.p1  ORF type:complete len:289 (+),score=29.55 GHVN01002020.1:159-1025(+)
MNRRHSPSGDQYWKEESLVYSPRAVSHARPGEGSNEGAHKLDPERRNSSKSSKGSSGGPNAVPGSHKSSKERSGESGEVEDSQKSSKARIGGAGTVHNRRSYPHHSQNLCKPSNCCLKRKAHTETSTASDVPPPNFASKQEPPTFSWVPEVKEKNPPLSDSESDIMRSFLEEFRGSAKAQPQSQPKVKPPQPPVTQNRRQRRMRYKHPAWGWQLDNLMSLRYSEYGLPILYQDKTIESEGTLRKTSKPNQPPSVEQRRDDKRVAWQAFESDRTLRSNAVRRESAFHGE